jgi:hypothetical protein
VPRCSGGDLVEPVTDLPQPPPQQPVVRIGIIAAPGTASEVASVLALDLPERLARSVPGVAWEIEQIQDRLAEPPARDAEIVSAARQRLVEHGWNLAICLTDLPLTVHRRPVVAHASRTHGVAVISLPALGPRLRTRAADVAARLVLQLLGVQGGGNDDRVLGRRVVEMTADGEDAGSVRFAANVLAGNVRLLLGMVGANQPWRLALGLSRALVAALVTMAFALVTIDLWQIAAHLGTVRSSILTVLAIVVPVVTLVWSANLWERTSDPRARRQVVLFNMATLATVVIGVLSLYVALAVLTVLGALLLVPPALLSHALGHAAHLGDYARLAWVTTSLATLAGALGAGLEKDESVRVAAYRYWPNARTEAEPRGSSTRASVDAEGQRGAA